MHSKKVRKSVIFIEPWRFLNRTKKSSAKAKNDSFMSVKHHLKPQKKQKQKQKQKQKKKKKKKKRFHLKKVSIYETINKGS